MPPDMISVFISLLIAIALLVPTHSEVYNAKQSLTNCDSLDFTQIGFDIETEDISNSVYSLSLSEDGKIVAIGVPFNNGNGEDSGHVRIYGYSNSLEWTQLGNDIYGDSAGDRSGHSVSLSANGKVVAIGAYLNSAEGWHAGNVRIYEYDNSSEWTQLGSNIYGESFNDWSGVSVSLSADGKTVAIGAVYNDGNGTNSLFDSGHVRIYGYNNNSEWTQLGSDIDGESQGDESGVSVSLSQDGRTVAIGAAYNGDNGTTSGHTRVYVYNNNSEWTQLGNDIDGESAGDFSGWPVSLSANGVIVAIGAFGNGDNSGHVRIYGYSGTSGWTQLGNDIDGESAGDESGRSVSLSADGKIVAIGAPYNDGSGSKSGHVRIFGYRETSGWTQLGSDINGESAGDELGWSSSLSKDGSAVAIGAKGYTRLISIQCANENPKFAISEPKLVTHFQDTPGQHGDEVILSYNVTTPNTCDTTFSVRIYKEGCTNYTEHSHYIDVSSTKINGTEIPQNNYSSCLQGDQTLDVFLDIKEDAITKSPFFEFIDPSVKSSAEIKFCQRFMLSHDIDEDGELPPGDQEFYEVVHFQETNIKVYLDFSRLFIVGSIDLEPNSIAKKNGTATVESDLKVYQCDSITGDDISNDDEQNKIAPGSVVSICFSTNSTNIGIHDVQSLTFQQETTGISIVAIADGNPNPITTSAVDKTTPIPNKKWRVLSQLILPFFDGSLGGVDYDVIAFGTVIMQYQDDAANRRFLRSKVYGKKTVTAFEIKLRLVEDDEY